MIRRTFLHLCFWCSLWHPRPQVSLPHSAQIQARPGAPEPRRFVRSWMRISAPCILLVRLLRLQMHLSPAAHLTRGLGSFFRRRRTCASFVEGCRALFRPLLPRFPLLITSLCCERILKSCQSSNW